MRSELRSVALAVDCPKAGNRQPAAIWGKKNTPEAVRRSISRRRILDRFGRETANGTEQSSEARPLNTGSCDQHWASSFRLPARLALFDHLPHRLYRRPCLSIPNRTSILTPRLRASRIADAEDTQNRGVDGGGKVHRAGIVGDHQAG